MGAGDPLEVAAAGPDYYQETVPISAKGNVNVVIVQGQPGYLIQVHAIAWNVSLVVADTTERIIKYELLDPTGTHFAWFTPAVNLFAGGAITPPNVHNFDVLTESQGFSITNPQTNDNAVYGEATSRFPPLPSGWQVKIVTTAFNAGDQLSAIRMLLQRAKVSRTPADSGEQLPPGISTRALAFLLHTP